MNQTGRQRGATSSMARTTKYESAKDFNRSKSVGKNRIEDYLSSVKNNREKLNATRRINIIKHLESSGVYQNSLKAAELTAATSFQKLKAAASPSKATNPDQIQLQVQPTHPDEPVSIKDEHKGSEQVEQALSSVADPALIE